MYSLGAQLILSFFHSLSHLFTLSFLGTVNGPTHAQQEPSISQAYAILRKTVYNGGVTVQAIIPFELNPVS